MIAEAVYYKAEKRSFRLGNELRLQLETRGVIEEDFQGSHTYLESLQINTWTGNSVK